MTKRFCISQEFTTNCLVYKCSFKFYLILLFINVEFLKSLFSLVGFTWFIQYVFWVSRFYKICNTQFWSSKKNKFVLICSFSCFLFKLVFEIRVNFRYNEKTKSNECVKHSKLYLLIFIIYAT